MEKFDYLKPEVKMVWMHDPLMDEPGDTWTPSVTDEEYDGEFGTNDNNAWDADEQDGVMQYSVWE